MKNSRKAGYAPLWMGGCWTLENISLLHIPLSFFSLSSEQTLQLLRSLLLPSEQWALVFVDLISLPGISVPTFHSFLLAFMEVCFRFLSRSLVDYT